jgi:hypothetical protein
MISSCRCYGVPDLLRVPSPSSCRMGPISKGSADTVLVSTLRFERRSSSVCHGIDVGCHFHWSVAVFDNTIYHCYDYSEYFLSHNTHFILFSVLTCSQYSLCNHSREHMTRVLKSHKTTLANHISLICLPVCHYNDLHDNWQLYRW